MENLNIGISLLIIGMSTVFIFLAIMIFAMNITAKIISTINKYFPEAIPEEEKNTQKKKQDDTSEIALAIAVAMREKVKVN